MRESRDIPGAGKITGLQCMLQSKDSLEKLLGVLEPKLVIRGLSPLPGRLSQPCSVIVWEQLAEEDYLYAGGGPLFSCINVGSL